MCHLENAYLRNMPVSLSEAVVVTEDFYADLFIARERKLLQCSVFSLARPGHVLMTS